MDFQDPDPGQELFKASIKAVDGYIDGLPEREDFHERNKHQSSCFDRHTHDVHCEDTILLFRHFVDAIIRVAYIKDFFSLDKIGLAVEGLMLDNVVPILMQGDEVINLFSDEETYSFEYVEKKLTDKVPMSIFDQNSTFRNLGIKNHTDRTSNLRLVMDLLAKGGLCSTVEDREMLIAILERYFSPDTTYTGLKKKWQQKEIEMNLELQGGVIGGRKSVGSDGGVFQSGTDSQSGEEYSDGESGSRSQSGEESYMDGSSGSKG